MMKLFILSIMLFLNFLFCISSHPMSFGLIIILQTLIMALILGMMSLTFWFSYIILLIMIGALLILFIYMTSLTPNKKFKFNKKMMIFSSMFLLLTFSFNFFNKNILMIYENKIDMTKMNNFYFNNNEEEIKSLLWMYDKLSSELTFTLMNYLLYVLMIIVTIINIDLGTMRKLN